MKSHLVHYLAVVLAALGPLMAVADPPASADTAKAGFLGVGVEEASPALRRQLGLQPGTGLVVAFVRPGSPAATAGLKEHDLLVDLHGQQLITARQFAVLISNAGPGQEVEITLVREGKQQTLSAALGATERREIGRLGEGGFDVRVGPLHAADMMGGFGTAAEPAVGKGGGMDMMRPRKRLPDDAGHTMEMFGNVPNQRLREQIREQIRGAFRQSAPKTTVTVAPGVSTAVSIVSDVDAVGTGSFTRSDGEHTLEVTVNNGRKQLVARDAAGKVLFEGPINTEEERAGIPDEVKGKLQNMEAIQVHTIQEFSVDDVAPEM